MLYMANVFDELLSETTLRLLEAERGPVHGNWLSGHRSRPYPRPGDSVVLAPSTLDDALCPEQAAVGPGLAATWVLFPDQAVGWDFQRHDYRYQSEPVLTRAIDLAGGPILVNSWHTARVLRRAGLACPLQVVPLAIDVAAIDRAAKASRDSETADGVCVLWAHMWRTQKDPESALVVLDKVLSEEPVTRVIIGRADSWAGPIHSPSGFRETMNGHLHAMRFRYPGRISIVPWFEDPTEYWSRLGRVDISLSCSREESFGIGMLEHAAAGIACVVPDGAAYPELHPGARQIPAATTTALASAVLELARDPAQRHAVAAACRQHATAFPPQRTVEELLIALDRRQ